LPRSLFVLAALAAFIAAPARAAELKVQEIKAYLVFEDKGTLSENIVGSKRTFFNTVAGDGEAGGMAHDILVDVLIAGADPTPAGEKSAIKATYVRPGQHNAVINRTWTTFYFAQNPVIHEFVYLEDATCAMVQIEAHAAKSIKTATLKFDCGE
jgi:hypothetical protein